MKQAWLLLSFFLFFYSSNSPAMSDGGKNNQVPVKIKRVLLINDSPAVLLVDKPEEEFMLVFIDFFMANAISLGMAPPVLERPLTHDLMGIFIRRLGAKVARIDITELKNNTYYALITLEVNGQSQQIDARPSDALALAVRNKTPIFADRSLLKPVGQEEQKGQPIIPQPPKKKPKPKPRT